MSRRIIQFGTSRFLQAHVDLFVHQARLSGEAIGPITVVKTTPGSMRSGRIEALREGRPFPVRIRGIERGRVIDDTIAVASVDQAFDAQEEWRSVVRCFSQDAEMVVSNVGDNGYERSEEDIAFDFGSQDVPASFPAKLLALLLARYREGGRPLLILPTELVSGNGRRLARIVSDLAAASRQPTSFQIWLGRSVVFADTLVDRIVSEPIEPVGAVAEPYALWAIRKAGFPEPFRHPALQLVNDLEPFERLKLHILNLGHSALADRWISLGGPADETVRATLSKQAGSEYLTTIYAEVLQGFTIRDMREEANRYIATTRERFENPFLAHRLADIAQNHAAKLGRRVGDFLAWVRERDASFAAPRLDAMLAASDPAGRPSAKP